MDVVVSIWEKTAMPQPRKPTRTNLNPLDNTPFTRALKRVEDCEEAEDQEGFWVALREMGCLVDSVWSMAKTIALAPPTPEGEEFIRELIVVQERSGRFQNRQGGWHQVYLTYKGHTARATAFGFDQILRVSVRSCGKGKDLLFVLRLPHVGSETHQEALAWAKNRLPHAPDWKPFYLQIAAHRQLHRFYQELTGEELVFRDPSNPVAGFLSRPITR